MFLEFFLKIFYGFFKFDLVDNEDLIFWVEEEVMLEDIDELVKIF